MTPQGQPQELLLPAPSCRPRRFHRTIEFVPARQPGVRRADAWWLAWWQEPLGWQLSEAAGDGDLAAGAALERRMAEATEMAGWTAIRPGAPHSFNTLVRYTLAG